MLKWDLYDKPTLKGLFWAKIKNGSMKNGTKVGNISNHK